MPRTKHQTKHHQATMEIRAIVNSLSPNSFLPLTSELVKELNYSHGTIIQALKPLVEDGLIKKILGKQRYVVNESFEQKSATIAILRPAFPSLDMDAIIQSIQEAAIGKMWKFEHFSFSDWSNFNFVKMLDTTNATILIPPAQMIEQSFIEPLLRPHNPTLVLLQHMEQFNCCNICADDYLVGQISAEALVAKGHKNILFILDQPQESTTLQRLRGFRDELKKHDITHAEELLLTIPLKCFSPVQDTVYQVFTEYLSQKKCGDFSAIFCSSFVGAMVVMRVLREHNYSIPQDMALLAFGGEAKLAPYLNPQLSTVEIDCSEYGTYSLELLEKLLDKDENRILRKKIKPKLVLRETL